MSQIKSLKFLAVCLALILSHSIQAQEWDLVWSDEFNTPGLPDSEKWGYEEGLLRNAELQYYTVERSENARIEDTTLIIEARKESYEGADYTSASLISRYKGDWRYGRFEVRAKIPTGKGSWPAIWMMPTYAEYGGWPRSGEIDIMENVGHNPSSIHQTVHIEGTDGSGHQGVGGYEIVTDAFEKFYTYSVEWNEDSIAWFIDDEHVYNYKRKEGADTRTWPFNRKFYMILNQAIGGNWGGQQGVDDSLFPHRLEIDYVRVYQQPAGEGPFTVSLTQVEGGTVELDPVAASYEKGSTVQVTASPENGYYFERFVDFGTQNPATITITEDTEIVPVFVKIASEGELLHNGDFENGIEGWDNIYIYDKSSQEASFEVENGQLRVEVIKPAAADWHMGFQQMGLGFIQDTSYRISFDAWAEVPGDVIIHFARSYGDYGSYFTKSGISITTEPARYSVEFDISEASDVNCRLYFGVGDFPSGKVYFDNISMTKASYSTVGRQVYTPPLFNIYPNPVQTSARIVPDRPLEGKLVMHVYASTGRRVRTMEIANQEELIFEKGRLEAGFYFVEIVGQQRWRTKILVL